jgi:hypothetical protein
MMSASDRIIIFGKCFIILLLMMEKIVFCKKEGAQTVVEPLLFTMKKRD